MTVPRPARLSAVTLAIMLGPCACSSSDDDATTEPSSTLPTVTSTVADSSAPDTSISTTANPTTAPVTSVETHHPPTTTPDSTMPATSAPAATTISTTAPPPTTAAPESTTTEDVAPVTESAPPSGTGLVLGSFGADTVRNAGFEAIGCYLRPGEDFDSGSILFTGYDGALIQVDGQAITMRPAEGDPVVIDNVAAGTTYSGNGYSVTFTQVGPERSTSIESADRDVTIEVAGPDGASTSTAGVLGCGV